MIWSLILQKTATICFQINKKNTAQFSLSKFKKKIFAFKQIFFLGFIFLILLILNIINCWNICAQTFPLTFPQVQQTRQSLFFFLPVSCHFEEKSSYSCSKQTTFGKEPNFWKKFTGCGNSNKYFCRIIEIFSFL